MLPEYVLKLGTYLAIYTALFLSQVIYTNVYDPTVHSYERRGKRNTISKWLKIIKDWFKTKAINIGFSIEQWNLTQKSKQQMQKTKRITTCMQIPNKRRGIHSLMAFTAVAMQASEGIHDNAVMFNTGSAPIGVDNRCMGCISNWSN
jgi:hypothetical protein